MHPGRARVGPTRPPLLLLGEAIPFEVLTSKHEANKDSILGGEDERDQAGQGPSRPNGHRPEQPPPAPPQPSHLHPAGPPGCSGPGAPCEEPPQSARHRPWRLGPPAFRAQRASWGLGAGRARPGAKRAGTGGVSPGSAGPGPRGPRATESGKRMDCPALPPGWKKEEVIRKSGLSAGKSDVYYFSPSGKKFRSKPQLARYLGNTVDLSSFDFRTGKMMPSKLQKNKQRLRNDPLNQNKGKPDLNTTLPIRQTASIFKQPVTKVTNHPSNKVKSDPQRMNEQPRQLFWEKRLQGLSASDVTEQIIKTMELPKGLQGVGPGSNDETLLSAVASALHTSSAPITGQVSAAVEKNPAVWLNTSQPLCKAFIVTDEDIRKQEERVQQVRKKLEEALMADILSRAADTEEMDVEMDSGDEA
ncbi:methyl-CpG-binding domain protein 2 [Marmota marmota marmota]|uniref:methyl-CpG-binding domain protein 2 n=1 Tax=Marmota marmota marmota TaxID=9994 RepID=UPI0020924A6F|nr:methyl-CpG-binding domain protein 2 [Marmota marmota marmota]